MGNRLRVVEMGKKPSQNTQQAFSRDRSAVIQVHCHKMEVQKGIVSSGKYYMFNFCYEPQSLEVHCRKKMFLEFKAPFYSFPLFFFYV